MLSQFLATHSSIQGALPILIDAALKGAILVLIAAVAAYLLQNRSAASRHAAWTAAVIGHLAIPALVLLLPAWKMPLLPAASWMPAEAAAPIVAPSVTNGKPTGDAGKQAVSATTTAKTPPARREKRLARSPQRRRTPTSRHLLSPHQMLSQRVRNNSDRRRDMARWDAAGAAPPGIRHLAGRTTCSRGRARRGWSVAVVDSTPSPTALASRVAHSAPRERLAVRSRGE